MTGGAVKAAAGAAAMMTWAAGTAEAAYVAAQAPSWQTLSMLFAAVMFGVAFMWYAKRELTPRETFDKAEHDRDERCKNCQKVLEEHAATFVTKESLKMQLDPMVKELEHRKSSMDHLGRFVKEMSDAQHEMDKKLTAILTKLDDWKHRSE